MSSHEYGALIRSWVEWGVKKNIKIIQQEVKLPLTNESEFIESIWRGVTPKTKVIFLQTKEIQHAVMIYIILNMLIKKTAY